MPKMGDPTTHTVLNGWVFPMGPDIDIPDQHWYKIDFGGNVQHDLDREGHLYLARQCGLESAETTVTHTGADDGVLFAAAETTLTFEDGTTWTAVGGADASSNQVRDPEHVWSVSGTRSVKRAVKRSLGIRSAEGPSPTDRETESESVTENAPEGVDDPPSEWEASESGGDLDW